MAGRLLLLSPLGGSCLHPSHGPGSKRVLEGIQARRAGCRGHRLPWEEVPGWLGAVGTQGGYFSFPLELALSVWYLNAGDSRRCVV